MNRLLQILSQNTQPVTMRRFESELYYTECKKKGDIRPIDNEPIVVEFEYWKVVENRFPYDMIFKKHDMLIPKRQVSEMSHLSQIERGELEKILETYVDLVYDIHFVNSRKKRSVPSLFHIHLCSYVDKRSDIKK